MDIRLMQDWIDAYFHTCMHSKAALGPPRKFIFPCQKLITKVHGTLAYN